MRKRTWKTVAIMVALAIVFGLTGCEKEQTTNATNEPTSASDTMTTAAQTTDVPVKEEPVELTWLGFNQKGYSQDADTLTERLIEERFNVDITIIEDMDIFNKEQWNLFWAEGNTANLINHTVGVDIFKLVDQGLVRSFDESLLSSNMPNWMERVKSVVGEELVEDQIRYNDKIYFIPCTNYAKVQTYVMAARKDWMSAVGINEAPTTLNEFHDLLYAFTYNDPDGNGADDTYGIHGGTWMRFNYAIAAYGIWPDQYYNVDGNIVYTSTTEEYKQLLKTLNSWFEEGLIDPEFVTDDRNVQRQKWAEGSFGVLTDHPWWFAQSTANNVSDMLTNNDPSAQILFFSAFSGPNGDSGGFQKYPALYDQGAIFFGKDTTDEQIAKIMEIKESIASDHELFNRCKYGEEGVEYTIDENGKLMTTDEYNTENIVAKGLSQFFALMPETWDNNGLEVTIPSDLEPYEVSLSNNLCYGTSNFTILGINQAASTKGADITTIADEFYYNAITGNVDIDADWDDYVKSLNDAGLQEVITGYQEIID